ncbi:putative cytochrome b2, mitochondrial precursor (L-lactate ferricytochrome C oxidoreductase) [Flagelloscypha sp. PMI_526]|nr:putative cytochrome b2, mitochondrial precursor (L-lactate ferricytochrome C oxidoreductase) [Flagelloscypha sp. PMI_526]
MFSSLRFCSLRRLQVRSSKVGLIRLASASLQPRGLPLLWSTVALGGGVCAVTLVAQQSIREPVHLESHSTAEALIPFDEVSKHNTRDDCWVIIQGRVYDVTDFLDLHPGGTAVILKLAGKDATKIFMPIHPPTALQDQLKPSQYLGLVDPATVPIPTKEELTDDELRVQKARENMPPITSILTLQDMEDLAQKVLSETAWAYYRSDADSGQTYKNNEAAFSRYYFNPRVLRGAPVVDTSSTMLGLPTSIPFYISPAAMAKLGHPLGEVNMVRGAGHTGIIQGVSANASCSLEEMVAARVPGQPLIYQIYLNKDRQASATLLRKVERLGFDGIIFTVDVPHAGNRLLDQRTTVPDLTDAPGTSRSRTGKGIAQSISGYQDRNMTWDDIHFITNQTSLPLLIKGIQTIEDVLIASTYPSVRGVILSNHGGRQLDYVSSPLDLLYALSQTHPHLLSSSTANKFEVYIDGGVKSGGDIVKALCLGAKGVGLGRAFLYANACYGEEGVRRCVNILKGEFGSVMAHLGVSRIEDLKPEMVERAWWLGCGQLGSGMQR